MVSWPLSNSLSLFKERLWRAATFVQRFGNLARALANGVNHDLPSAVRKSAEVPDSHFINWNSNSVHLADVDPFDEHLQLFLYVYIGLSANMISIGPAESIPASCMKASQLSCYEAVLQFLPCTHAWDHAQMFDLPHFNNLT